MSTVLNSTRPKPGPLPAARLALPRSSARSKSGPFLVSALPFASPPHWKPNPFCESMRMSLVSRSGGRHLRRLIKSLIHSPQPRHPNFNFAGQGPVGTDADPANPCRIEHSAWENHRSKQNNTKIWNKHQIKIQRRNPNPTRPTRKRRFRQNPNLRHLAKYRWPRKGQPRCNRG